MSVPRFSLVEMPAAFGKGSGYGESGYVLIGEGAFSAGGGEDSWAASLVAHEVSHGWWGQEVRFSNFANESLASYATLRFLEADQGERVARRERRAAVERIVRAADSGKELALAEIRGFGSGMDPGAYRVHAYEKAMMLLWMIERAVGRKKMDRVLARLFEKQRGKSMDYRVLRKALAASGKGSRSILEQWEKPGIPRLDLKHETKASGTRFQVDAVLTQEGTPFRMDVEVVAVCGEQRVATTVKLRGREKKFRLVTPRAPDALLLDPDYHLVAARPSADPSKALEAVIRQVVNDSSESDPEVLRKAIATIERALQGDPGKYEGVCHTGLGRCHFRLGAGGPFHRAWVHLRLGNMAERDENLAKARACYERAVRQGMRYEGARRAARRLEKLDR